MFRIETWLLWKESVLQIKACRANNVEFRSPSLDCACLSCSLFRYVLFSGCVVSGMTACALSHIYRLPKSLSVSNNLHKQQSLNAKTSDTSPWLWVCALIGVFYDEWEFLALCFVVYVMPFVPFSLSVWVMVHLCFVVHLCICCARFVVHLVFFLPFV